MITVGNRILAISPWKRRKAYMDRATYDYSRLRLEKDPAVAAKRFQDVFRDLARSQKLNQRWCYGRSNVEGELRGRSLGSITKIEYSRRFGDTPDPKGSKEDRPAAVQRTEGRGVGREDSRVMEVGRGSLGTPPAQRPTGRIIRPTRPAPSFDR